MATALREAGVTISSLVRAAIRAEYLRRVSGGFEGERRRSDAVRAILAAVPDATEAPTRGFESTDKKAIRRHVGAKLSRERP